MSWNRLVRVGLLTVVLCGLASEPALAGFEVDGRISGDRVTLRNLIGRVQIEGHDGDAFEVRISVQGRDATEDRVQVEFIESGDPRIEIRFPLDESRDYVYPALHRSRTSFSMENEQSRGWFGKLFGSMGRREIDVRSSGRGLEIWADALIRVPRGKSLVVRHGVGDIDAANVRGDLDLDSHSGKIEARRVDGSVLVDTGSGKVRLSNIEGDRVMVDTGSGDVEVESIDTDTLNVDTGSGRVDARGILANDVLIDTGSGSVTLELDRMGDGKFDIDTGSGSIDLVLPAGASADVEADTGSGRIDIDVNADFRDDDSESDEARFVIGGGAARIRLDTGSGSITISEQR